MCARSCFVSAAAVMLLSGACSLFEPRTPEDPEEGGTPWIDPYFPSTVLVNMAVAFNDHQINFYMNCLDSSFVFQADQLDIDQYAGSLNFSDWNYFVEENVIMAIFAEAISSGGGYPEDSLLSMTLTVMPEYPDETAPNDSTIMYREYEIVIAGTEYCNWDNPATGMVLLHLIENSAGLWSVEQWDDFRLESTGDSLNTWGVSKAYFR